MRAPACMLFAAVLASLAPVPAAAGIDRAGTTAANFLALGSSPGVLGMGGAGLSLDGGLGTFDWNPATLARFGGAEVVFSHAALADQTAQEWAGIGSRLRFAGLSGAVTGLFQNEGTFEGRDALNNPTGTFEVSSMAVSAGLARAIGPFMTAGVGVKYASENLGGVRGSGMALDAGLQVRSGGFGFGAAAQNIGRMRYSAASYDFPASYGLGFSYQQPSANGLRVALDMNFPAAYYSDVRAGLEWRWNDRFALRTGYRAELGADGGEPLGGPTFGMGAGAGGMWLDYGYLVGGTGAGQHRIGITYRPGGFGSSSDQPEPRGGYGHAPTNAMPEAERNAPASGSATSKSPASSSAPASASAASKPPAPTSAPASVQQSTAVRPQASVPAPASAPGAAGASPTRAPVSPPASTRQSSPVSAPTTVSASAPKTSASSAPVASAPANPRASAPAPASAAPGTASASATGSASAAAPDAAASRPAAPEPKQGPRPEKVRVRGRETMADIARAYGTSVAAIMMENNLISDRVRSGQVLKLPRN